MNWQTWFSPEGVKTIIEFVIVLMSAVTAILALMGKKDAAAKLEEAKDKIETHEATIANATKTVVAVVQGVEKFRNNAAPDQAQAVKDAIQSVTTAMGVEHIVQPLVKAATEGTGSAATALTTPNPVVPAPQPPV